MTKKSSTNHRFLFWSVFSISFQKPTKNPSGFAQEEYARKSGFLKEWRQISRTRLKEVLLVLFVMLSCRWLAVSFTQPSLAIILIAVSFSSTAVGCAAVTYTQLHIVAGMDLAIDSFCIHFFKEMDRPQGFLKLSKVSEIFWWGFFWKEKIEGFQNREFTHECFFRSLCLKETQNQ